MQKFSIVLISVFIALTSGSIQNVLAEDITDILKPVPIKNSEYQFHLQAVLRDVDGRLISATESTNGFYIPHTVTDELFDACFGVDICKKEIVVVDNIKYEMVQFTETYSSERVQNQYMRLMFFIPVVLEVSYGPETVLVDANLFQAKAWLEFEEGDVIITQWTILREIG